jgi:hypothetical protein
MPLKPIITLQLFDVHQNDPVFLLWFNYSRILFVASKNSRNIKDNKITDKYPVKGE